MFAVSIKQVPLRQRISCWKASLASGTHIAHTPIHHSSLYSFVGKDQKNLFHVKDTARETTLCLAAAHALVKLDDNTIVGDPMEKTTLEALEWTLGKGAVAPGVIEDIMLIVPDQRRTHFPCQPLRSPCHSTSHPTTVPIFIRLETHVDYFKSSRWKNSRCSQRSTRDHQDYAGCGS